MPDGKDSNVRIFTVETRYQKLARSAGGIPRDAAIEKAQAKVEEIKPDFEDWLTKELDSLAAVMNKAKAGDAQSDWINVVGHHARQLRDVGTTMGSELITYIANSLCEILDAMAAGSEYNMDSIVCHVDALFLARQKPYRGLKPDQVPQLTSGLRRVVDHISTSPS
jgi:hypothetical protein